MKIAIIQEFLSSWSQAFMPSSKILIHIILEYFCIQVVNLELRVYSLINKKLRTLQMDLGGILLKSSLMKIQIPQIMRRLACRFSAVLLIG